MNNLLTCSMSAEHHPMEAYYDSIVKWMSWGFIDNWVDVGFHLGNLSYPFVGRCDKNKSLLGK
jgi:hypothetical protein